jgi:hypothetical protein
MSVVLSAALDVVSSASCPSSDTVVVGVAFAWADGQVVVQSKGPSESPSHWGSHLKKKQTQMPVMQLDQNPFDFEIIAHTRGISKCSPPWSWMEHWRQVAGFSYGDFAMECFSMPRSGVDEAKFIHCLKLSKHRSAINSLRRGPPNREVGHWTFPAEVLWSACKFGDMKWICPTSKEEYFLEINPTAGCGDIERAVQACLEDVPEGLRDQVSETGRLLQEACVSSPSPSSSASGSGSGSGSLSGSGCLGEACMPSAFEPIESWFHVATDATSLFQAGFCTESRWFWMWSSSS